MTTSKTTASQRTTSAPEDAIAMLKADHEAVAARRDDLLSQAA